MFKWIQLALEQYKTIMAILVLLGVSGVSIYGNINESNPWKSSPSAEQETPVTEVQVKVVETRVETGITEQQVKTIVNARWKGHIEEFH